jgi:DNA repair protein RadC
MSDAQESGIPCADHAGLLKADERLMDSPLESAGAPSRMPVDDGRSATDFSFRHTPPRDDGQPSQAWLSLTEPRAAESITHPARVLDGDPGIGLRAGYWRYLQNLSWSEADVFNASELLELLLYFGRSGENAGTRAAKLLDRFGSLSAVMAAEPAKLAQILEGDSVSVILLKAVRASVKAIVREPLEDRPVISSASALMDYLSVTMRHEPIEATRILFLDRKNALIKDEIQHRGTVDHTPLYPREVVKRVVELGASAIILVHNHPSGDPTPSQGDIEMTRRLAAALNTINVVLHDHVIVGRNRETSLRKLKLV